MAIKSNEMERRQGFTLLEMLIVVAIIGVLVAILMSAVGGIKAKAIQRRTEVEVQSLAMAIRAYHTELGDWPLPSGNPDVGGVWSNNNKQVFAMLVKLNNHRRNYIELTNSTPYDLVDPYRRVYVVNIDVSNNFVKVTGAGKDGVLGSKDDIAAQY